MLDNEVVLPDARSYDQRPPRKRTYLAGKLVYSDGQFVPDGSFTLDCTIRDISDGGARIILPKHQLLPADLYLIAVKYCVAYCAKVVWLDFPERGLQFSRTYPLAAPLPDDLKFLRNLWGDLYLRSSHDPDTTERISGH